jgi:hypothetical protein
MMERSEFLEARTYLEACLKAFRRQGRRSIQAITHCILVACLAELGEWNEVDAHLVWVHLLLDQTEVVAEDIAIMAQRTGELALRAGLPEISRETLALAASQWTAVGRQEMARKVENTLGRLG